MKRFVFLFFVSLLCFSGCSLNKDESVNPLRIETSVIECSGEETSTIQYQYNEQGFIQQEVKTVNGEPEYTISYEYDEWGNTIREFFLHSDGSNSTTEYFYTLDKEHRPVYREAYFDTELNDCLEITYDNKGREIHYKSTIIRPGKDESITSEMTYDRNGRLTKKDVKWSNDPSNGGVSLYHYEKDRLIREDFHAPAGWLKNYIIYSYDDTGLIQTAMEYNGNGSLQSKTITAFDEYSNILHYEYYRYSRDIPGSGDDIADRIVTNTYEEIDSEG